MIITELHKKTHAVLNADLLNMMISLINVLTSPFKRFFLTSHSAFISDVVMSLHRDSFGDTFTLRFSFSVKVNFIWKAFKLAKRTLILT